MGNTQPPSPVMAGHIKEGDGEQELAHVSISVSSPSEPADSDVHGEDEATRLRALAADVRDQDDLERDVGRQVQPKSLLSVLPQLSPVIGRSTTHRAG